MAHRFRVAPLALALVAAPAAGQVGQPEGAVSAAPGSNETGAPSGGVPGELNVDGVYTIKSGDTLWDLSQQFLSNPWYWPKIWAENPYIENPHWIYPGNQLRIRFNPEGLPAEVSAAPVEEPEEVYVPTPKTEIADFTTGSVHRADNLGQAEDLVSIAGRGKIALAAPDELRVRISSIITTRELAETGVIVSSFEQKELLSTFDRVYVKVEGQRPRIGDQFSIFRTRNEVTHPKTGERFGFQTEILGALTIVAVEKDVAVGEIGAVSEYVLRGDRVGPAAVLDKLVRPSPNVQDVSALVLATDIPRQREIGETHVVFLDKGSKAGVAEGNTFTVVHAGDGLSRLSLDPVNPGRDEAGMPLEPVATLLVFDVREDSSAAMVVKSLREVKVGDRAEMRALALLPGAGGD